MSIIEVIGFIIAAEQLREKAAAESAAKDQGAETATKADAKSSAERSEKKIVMIRKIADGIYEISGIPEGDLKALKAAAREIAAREEQIRRRRKMVDESMFAPFTREGFIGMMDLLACLSRPDYMDFMDFLRSGAQADQSKNDTDKS